MILERSYDLSSFRRERIPLGTQMCTIIGFLSTQRVIFNFFRLQLFGKKIVLSESLSRKAPKVVRLFETVDIFSDVVIMQTRPLTKA